jgi:hypothetical protein
MEPIMAKFKTRSPLVSRPLTETLKEQITALHGLEDEWLKARARGDATLSERLLDDAYRGSNSDGVIHSKVDFLNAMRSSANESAEGEHTDREIQIVGDVALSLGVATIRHSGRTNSFRYLRVYVKHGDEWRLLASQSTRLGKQ